MAAKGFEIRRVSGGFTEYNPKADYSINVPGLPNAVNKGLSDACRSVAKTGSVMRCEVLALVDLNSGKRAYYETGDYNSVGGTKFWDFIKARQNDRFAFVTNMAITAI